VRAPLWSVEEDGVLYAETLSKTGKIERLRRKPHVRLVPFDQRGEPEGECIEGEAYLVEGEEAKRARELLSKKYGVQKRLVSVMFRFMKGEQVIISMQVRSAKPNM
jgi:PPOX class probable F420-dependent enzyme